MKEYTKRLLLHPGLKKRVTKSDYKKMLLPAIGKRYSEDEVREVIAKCYGVKTLIACELDCTQIQLKNYLSKHQHLKQDIMDAREGIVARAEEVILKALNSDDEKIRLDAAKMTLRTLGGSHGWYDQGTQPMKIDIKTTDDKRVEVKAIFGIQDEDGEQRPAQLTVTQESSKSDADEPEFIDIKEVKREEDEEEEQ